MLLKSNDGQFFNWQDTKGEIHPNVCPYFEGKEVIAYLNANNEVGNYALRIEVNYCGAIKTILVPFEALCNPSVLRTTLAAKGLLYGKKIEKDVEALLNNQANELITSSTVVHTMLGIKKLNNQFVFVQQYNQVGGQKYRYTGKIKLRYGDKQIYDTFLNDTVFKSRTLTLAFMIGMSAPVISLLVEEGLLSDKLIIINFVGKSSTGKSSLTRLALSSFGNPNFSSDGLGIGVSTTDNALFGALEGVNGLPRALDDINQNPSLKMEKIIYTAVAGEPKLRMGAEGQCNAGWSGILIITSETPIILETDKQGGIHSRVITLELEKWADSKEEATLVCGTVKNNYGWTGQDFAEHIIGNIAHVRKRFEEISKKVSELITIRDSLTDRISDKIAAIALTIDLYLTYYPNAFSWSYLDLLQPLIESEHQMVIARDTGETILNIVREYISTNKIKFNMCYVGHYYDQMDATSPIGTIVSYYVCGECYMQEVYIYCEAFKGIMRENKFADYNSGLDLLKKRGLLKTEKGRRTIKKDGLRSYCIIVYREKRDPRDPEGDNSSSVGV